MDIETSNWSGDGSFTEALIESLKEQGSMVYLRVEDAPATHADTGYQFISNEVFVAFASRERVETIRWFGFWPGRRRILEKEMSLDSLEQYLANVSTIGPCDYADEGMLQYLRTERIVPPYQTRGYKLVELVRIYEVEAPKSEKSSQ